jgi:hypothetical protein
VIKLSLKVVYGAPCSGKSTYVKKHIGKKDIAYDYDEITRALTYGKEHLSKREITHRYVLDIRYTLINRYKKGTDVETFWLILTFLTDGFKELLKDLDVEYIKMDTDQEECLKRLENDDMRPDKEDWKLKIVQWFNQHSNKSGEKRTQTQNNKVKTQKHLETTYVKRYVNPYRELK